ncbi:hypothetical protein A0256_13455 [Mucilaginibacter sp. PAMC 26640]|nr:hypothetical protein A0256_13455 [Mucilaginibacter sp. PAMC 26640]
MDWKDEGNGFDNLVSDIANMQADFILEKNAKYNLVKVNEYLTAIKERVHLEEETGSDEITKCLKALGFSFYELKEAFELMLIERN